MSPTTAFVGQPVTAQWSVDWGNQVCFIVVSIVGPGLSKEVAQSGTTTVVPAAPGTAAYRLEISSPHGTRTLRTRTLTVLPLQRMPSVAAARNADGRLELAMSDDADRVVHGNQTAPSGGLDTWIDAGNNPSAYSVAAETNADGRVEIFGTDRSGQIFHSCRPRRDPAGGRRGRRSAAA